MDWAPSAGINCLIGPGDSGKSSVLEAIDLCLGARRSARFSDTDFHLLNVAHPIQITVTVGALPDELLNLDTYGEFLRGFDTNTKLVEANWRLYKTCRWNSVQNKNKAEKIFPAQYYILAVIEKDPNVSAIDVNLKNVEFYLCSGRTLDRHVSPSRKSVGYKKFSNLSIRCTFSDLVNTLYHLQRQEHERVRLLLAPGWKLPLPASFELKPLAVEASDTVTAIWHQDGDDTLLNATPIDVPWVEGVTPDWRDWEAAGFKYDPQVEVSPCIAGQPT